MLLQAKEKFDAHTKQVNSQLKDFNNNPLRSYQYRPEEGYESTKQKVKQVLDTLPSKDQIHQSFNTKVSSTVDEYGKQLNTTREILGSLSQAARKAYSELSLLQVNGTAREHIEQLQQNKASSINIELQIGEPLLKACCLNLPQIAELELSNVENAKPEEWLALKHCSSLKSIELKGQSDSQPLIPAECIKSLSQSLQKVDV